MAITIQSQQWESGEVISATKLNAMVNDITALGTNSNNLEEKVTTKALTVQGALETTSASVDIKKATNIAGTTTITGDFEVKSGNNTILKAENASDILKVSIPNQLIVGTANTENDTTTYIGATTFNTATTEIHGATTIDQLTAANVAGNASIDGTVTAKDGLEVGTATQARSAKIYGTLETTGNATIGGTLETNGNTTINGDLTVSNGRLSATQSALLGRTDIGSNGVSKDLRVYGTTTTNDLVVNNKITSLVMGETTTDDLIVNNKITNLTMGTATTDTLTVNNKITSLTIGGTTTDTLTVNNKMTNLNIGTITIDTLTVGAITENENTGLTEISGETTLHGITKIDSLIVGQYPNIPQNHNFIEIVGYGADDNNTNNIRTLDISGNQRIAGTYYGNDIVINKFNGIDIPALPIVENSLEDPKPYEDGEYMLKLTITDGQPSYSWVAIGGAEP